MGIERLLMIMDEQNCAIPSDEPCELYLAPMGKAAVKRCFELATRLREGGLSVEFDVVGRSLKAQMKYADKLGALYTIVVGDNELETGKAQLKDMRNGTVEEIELGDGLYTALYNKAIDRQLAGVADIFTAVAEN
jgi:histidyl-tRNA synthetase